MSADYALIKLALRNQVLTVGSLPTARAWENETFKPTTNTPYVEEDFVPATATLRGLVRGGMVEYTGLYVIKWYGVTGHGTSTIDAGVTALLNLFSPGSHLSLTSGDVVRIRGDVAPTRGQLLQAAPGWACVAVKIFWRLETQNAP